MNLQPASIHEINLELLVQFGTPAQAFAAKELLKEEGTLRALGIVEADTLNRLGLPTTTV